MKNVTISLDDDTHRAARVRAAELGTSLSALVKEYLNGLATGAAPGTSTGVREMSMPFKHAEPVKDGPPWLIGGEWVYTPDGKPRQPGSMRHMAPLPDEWDEWPENMLAFFDKLQSEPWSEDDLAPLP
jgi:hypothetical protein